MEEEKVQKMHIQYGSMLYRVAFSYMRNKADAEDAVQETYIRFLQKQPDFENEEHRKAWLLRTAVNICRDIQKSAWNNKTIGLEAIPEKEKNSLVMPYGIQDETIWIVMSLSEKYRLPLYLFYYEGYSIREIGEILGIPESTVKTHLRRGREAVKEQLEK